MSPVPAAGPASWLSDAELAVYVQEFGRTTFRGGLQWYRRGTAGLDAPALDLLAGRVIAQPSTFIAGAADWGVYQNPGALGGCAMRRARPCAAST